MLTGLQPSGGKLLRGKNEGYKCRQLGGDRDHVGETGETLGDAVKAGQMRA